MSPAAVFDAVLYASRAPVTFPLINSRIQKLYSTTGLIPLRVKRGRGQRKNRRPAAYKGYTFMTVPSTKEVTAGGRYP